MVHLAHKLMKGAVYECLCPSLSRTQLQKDITFMTMGADRLDKDSD